ncbi:MAG: hypothetical protein HQL22_07810 [Candidatus Omnitrophica bacterium]|nr:hypothetical protein [Candidatus Omnitrophota bacterium]
MIGKSDKCFSPWFGFLVIVVVCVVIAGAVFFESKESAARRRAKRHMKQAPQAAIQAAPVAVTDTTAGTGKVLF